MVKNYETKILNPKNPLKYGITIKYNKSDKDITEDTYGPQINVLKRVSDEFNYVFEDATKDGRPCPVHVHGVIIFKRSPRFTSLLLDGFHMKHEKIYDEEGWLRYMNKNKVDLDAIPDLSNYFDRKVCAF